jgi:hypothetical protein
MSRHAIAAGLLIAAAAFTAATTGAHACACCADPGQRVERFVAFSEADAFAAQAIGKLELAGQAALFRNAADWEEVIRGIDNPDKSEAYTVSLSRKSDAWTLSFADDKGNSGDIAIRLPREFEAFAADTTPGDNVTGSGPKLYKELRFTGVMAGTGMFKVSSKGTRRATLVFHGRGSGCTFAEQFTHWTLIATGPGVRYSFFGKLKAS